NDVIGHGVVLHQQVDDCVTQPTGNSGTKFAQGVLGYANGSFIPSHPDHPIDSEIPNKQAIAVLTPIGKSGVEGVAVFNQTGANDVVKIKVFVKGLQPGSLHGIHVHKFGDIRDNVKGETAGPHFNPHQVTHGCYYNKGHNRHFGDFNGNLTADSNGIIKAEIVSELLTLYRGEDATAQGHALVLHSGPDDCVTDPTGNSGTRLAFGVIGDRNSSAVLPQGVWEGWGNGYNSVEVKSNDVGGGSAGGFGGLFKMFQKGGK
ncbi:hypothetical protein HDU76_007385, partial [Blyttiomyces sp. JEL0837]